MSFSLLGLICPSSHVRMYLQSLTEKVSILRRFPGQNKNVFFFLLHFED